MFKNMLEDKIIKQEDLFDKRLKRFKKNYKNKDDWFTLEWKKMRGLIEFLSIHKIYDTNSNKIWKKILLEYKKEIEEKQILLSPKEYKQSLKFLTNFNLKENEYFEDFDFSLADNNIVKDIIKKYNSFYTGLYYLIEDKTILENISEFFYALIVALILVVPFRHFIIEPYSVQGSSMSPNFETWDYILVNKFPSYLTKPERGDVIVFVPPFKREDSWRNFFPLIDRRQKYIKRVMALPGETVKLDDNKVWIKKPGWKEFKVLDEPYLKNRNLNDKFPLKLKDDEYYVLGDNRGHSYDSEDWGPIKYSDIIGEPIFRLFPFSELGVNPAEAEFEF